MNEPVLLSAQDFVAEGSDRKCFRHPQIQHYCIKLLHPERRSGRFWREINYFSSLRRRGVDFSRLAQFHGLVQTNMGRGAMFDLVLDDDQQVSKSLSHYLIQKDRRFNDWFLAEVEELKQFLYDQWIVIHDLNPTNILVKRLGFDEFRLVIVDGVGHNHFLPLASFSQRFARRKLTRIWNRRYRQWYSAYPLVIGNLKPYMIY